ncbi:MAG: hypothetical protein NVSMB62_28230 [Acidobacteriaceae bacterium]
MPRRSSRPARAVYWHGRFANNLEAVRKHLRRNTSRLVGFVGYSPEQYGEAVVRLALDIIDGKDTPPATFVKHQMITREKRRRRLPQ